MANGSSKGLGDTGGLGEAAAVCVGVKEPAGGRGSRRSPSPTRSF